MITPRQIKLIIYGVILIVAALLFRMWLNNRDERQNTEASLSQATQTGEATIKISDAGTEATQERAEVSTQVIEHRYYTERQQEQLRNENPTVDAWASGVIPVELRDADRKARLARQRSSDLSSGVETDSSAPKD